ncbi:ligand-gated ion channel [Methanospirillum lacunae]|uniref:Neurotransmitter-gated ion-channel ligand-binding domain-containing protein n=1 Tax=Methanospirillum lacunae TaxID=668570 RepID=A0A2V2NCG0_9EURY|nr:hypothetical protein [Methanospirillum lacunae]PWR72993.1 hypothetical protein DK846_05805 [Methanospirillum lacunae]
MSGRYKSGVQKKILLSFSLLLLVLALSTQVSSTVPDPATNMTVPHAVITVGVYVIDFKQFDIQEGTCEVDFYLHLESDTPVTINDIELMNGDIISADLTHSTPNDKFYRVHATVSTDLTLQNYPFDYETIRIEIEPKDLYENEAIFVIDTIKTGIDPSEKIDGWSFVNVSSKVDSQIFPGDGAAYSRAVFNFTMKREALSNVLKFFLPIFLIVLVSLFSLLMKVTSRLSLNSSMFLAAVLIHWRVVSEIPNLSYGVFLDIFMVITYATLIMVLISGILRIHFTDSGKITQAELVHRISIWFIPAFCLLNYLWLFYTLRTVTS